MNDIPLELSFFYLVCPTTYCSKTILSEQEKPAVGSELPLLVFVIKIIYFKFTSHLQEKNENAFLIDGKFPHCLPPPLLGIVVCQTKL